MIKDGAETAIYRALRNSRFVNGKKHYIIVKPHSQTIQGFFSGIGTYEFQGQAEIKEDNGTNEGLYMSKHIKGVTQIIANDEGEPIAEIKSISELL